MAEPNTATVEAPAGPDAGLDSAISAMEARLFPADGGPPAQQTSSTPAPTTPEQPAPPEQPADQPAPEPSGSHEDTDEELDTPSEPGKPLSRMGRLRQQLAQAEERMRQAEQRVVERDGQHQQALREFVDLVLPDHTFEMLRQKAEGGDWEAKQQLDTARQWRRMVAPIADLAHLSARQTFDAALQDLRTIDGMDGDSHQKLLQAASPGDKLKLMWDLGRKTADSANKERIAALETEVQALKTNRAANGSQPANGGSPGGTANGLAGLVDRGGLLTDDAMNLTPSEIRARFGRVA